MVHGQLPCVEREALGGGVVRIVEIIADDGVAETGEMDADLVFSTGRGADLQKTPRIGASL